MNYSRAIISSMVLALLSISNVSFAGQITQKDVSVKAPGASFGTWYVPGDTETSIASGDIIPFNTTETSMAITNSAGDFTLTKNGTYQVTFGVNVLESGDIFDIQLNGTLVAGGRLRPIPTFTVQPLTVMFTATANSHLVIRNTSGQFANIGTGDLGTVGAFISILQIK